MIIKWQPPWLTFVLGLGEFVIVYILGQVLDVGLQPIDAVWFYWVSWIMAVWTRIAVLPILSLHVDRERRRIPADRLVASPREPDHPGSRLAGGRSRQQQRGLLREFSSVGGQVPDELRDLPAPSAVRQVPARPAHEVTPRHGGRGRFR